MARGEVVLREAQQDAALAHGGVADDDELDQMVVLFLAIHIFLS